MAAGDIGRILSVYDPEAVLLDRSGRTVRGKQPLRAELAPLVQERAACRPAAAEDGQINPSATIAFATLMKPAMLAPTT